VHKVRKVKKVRSAQLVYKEKKALEDNKVHRD
jgi:hypothetical protein